ncbi:uncharacterized protein LOC141902243 [Tubulanus polymorphus]|uniref:uncharacterized protein LOC141902243 n=1 Tax=Tubulanus polymorphus TaxID=672921 RepID=UPI003DA61000
MEHSDQPLESQRSDSPLRQSSVLNLESVVDAVAPKTYGITTGLPVKEPWILGYLTAVTEFIDGFTKHKPLLKPHICHFTTGSGRTELGDDVLWISDGVCAIQAVLACEPDSQGFNDTLCSAPEGALVKIQDYRLQVKENFGKKRICFLIKSYTLLKYGLNHWDDDDLIEIDNRFEPKDFQNLHKLYADDDGSTATSQTMLNALNELTENQLPQPSQQPQRTSACQPSQQPQQTPACQPSQQPQPMSACQPSQQPQPTSACQPSQQPQPTSACQPLQPPQQTSACQQSRQPTLFVSTNSNQQQRVTFKIAEQDRSVGHGVPTNTGNDNNDYENSNVPMSYEEKRRLCDEAYRMSDMLKRTRGSRAFTGYNGQFDEYDAYWNMCLNVSGRPRELRSKEEQVWIELFWPEQKNPSNVNRWVEKSKKDIPIEVIIQEIKRRGKHAVEQAKQILSKKFPELEIDSTKRAETANGYSDAAAADAPAAPSTSTKGKLPLKKSGQFKKSSSKTLPPPTAKPPNLNNNNAQNVSLDLTCCTPSDVLPASQVIAQDNGPMFSQDNGPVFSQDNHAVFHSTQIDGASVPTKFAMEFSQINRVENSVEERRLKNLASLPHENGESELQRLNELSKQKEGKSIYDAQTLNNRSLSVKLWDIRKLGAVDEFRKRTDNKPTTNKCSKSTPLSKNRKLSHLPEQTTRVLRSQARGCHTESSSGQTESSSGQTESSSGHTESRSGQTESRSGQTESSSGQNESRSGQTESRSGQTESRSGQTESRSGHTELSSGQTQTSSGEMKSIRGQTESKSGKLESSIGQVQSSAGEAQSSTGQMELRGEQMEIETQFDGLVSPERARLRSTPGSVKVPTPDALFATCRTPTPSPGQAKRKRKLFNYKTVLECVEENSPKRRRLSRQSSTCSHSRTDSSNDSPENTGSQNQTLTRSQSMDDIAQQQRTIESDHYSSAVSAQQTSPIRDDQYPSAVDENSGNSSKQISDRNKDDLQPQQLQQQTSGRGSGLSENLVSEDSQTPTEGTQLFSIITEKTQSSSVRTEETQPSRVLTEESLPSSIMTEETQPSRVVTEESLPSSIMTEQTQPSSVVTEESLPSSIMTEQTQPFSIMTEESQASSIVTEETQRSSAVTEESLPSSIMTEETRPSSAVTTETQPFSIMTEDLTQSSPDENCGQQDAMNISIDSLITEDEAESANEIEESVVESVGNLSFLSRVGHGLETLKNKIWKTSPTEKKYTASKSDNISGKVPIVIVPQTDLVVDSITSTENDDPKDVNLEEIAKSTDSDSKMHEEEFCTAHTEKLTTPENSKSSTVTKTTVSTCGSRPLFSSSRDETNSNDLDPVIVESQPSRSTQDTLAQISEITEEQIPALSASSTPAPSASSTPGLSASSTPALSAGLTQALSASSTPAPSASSKQALSASPTPALSAGLTPVPSASSTPAPSANSKPAPSASSTEEYVSCFSSSSAANSEHSTSILKRKSAPHVSPEHHKLIDNTLNESSLMISSVFSLSLVAEQPLSQDADVSSLSQTLLTQPDGDEIDEKFQTIQSPVVATWEQPLSQDADVSDFSQAIDVARRTKKKPPKKPKRKKRRKVVRLQMSKCRKADVSSESTVSDDDSRSGQSNVDSNETARFDVSPPSGSEESELAEENVDDPTQRFLEADLRRRIVNFLEHPQITNE